MPFGMEVTDLIVILVVGFFLFGHKQMPEIGRGVGRAIQEFRRELQGTPPPPRPPAAAEGRHCPGCGTAVAATARYCQSCGAALPE